MKRSGLVQDEVKKWNDGRHDEVRKFIEGLTTESIDIFENTLPSALSDSQWCEATVREAFTKAKFIQEAIVQIPEPLAVFIFSKLSKSIKLTKLFPFFKDGSFHCLTNVADRLDIAFEINPILNPELKEIIHIYFVQLFGEAAFERTKFYSTMFLKYYAQNFNTFTKESSSFHQMELNANLQIALAQGSRRSEVVKSIQKSLSYRSSTFSDTIFLHTTVLIMLGNNKCNFIDEILTQLSYEMKSHLGDWDQELIDIYFRNADMTVLRKALINAENMGNQKLMELFIEIINSNASVARIKYSIRNDEYNTCSRDSVHRKWVVLDKKFEFQLWKTLLHQGTQGVLRDGKNAVEVQLEITRAKSINFNYDFWTDMFSP